MCDGVGLGKTFIGMMLIERLVEKERKRVALFVPKSARKPVWEKTLDRYCAEEIFGPLRMRETAYRPIRDVKSNQAHPADVSRIAPTERMPDGHSLRGVVHDPTAPF